MRNVVLLAFLFFIPVNRISAAIIVTASETNGNVVLNAEGTLNLDGLTNIGSTPLGVGFVQPDRGLFLVTRPFNGSGTVRRQAVYDGEISGPSAFGTGGATGSDVGQDDAPLIGIIANDLRVDADYESNEFITTSTTFTNQTFSSLGFIEGTYVWSWGSGENFDTLTLVIPEPTSLGLFGSLGLLALRRRSTLLR